MNFFANLIIKKTRLNLFVMVLNSSLCHKGGGDSTHSLSATFSAHRQLTEMGQCSMESSCPEDSKKYRLISMGGL